MQYTVVHSKDPYLLARLATELQMSGYEEAILNFDNTPFCDGFFWFDINPDGEQKMVFEFHNVEPYEHKNPICLSLTSRNYIKVLTQILEP